MLEGPEKSDKKLLPRVEEDISGNESISTFETDILTVDSLENDLFDDIRASLQRSNEKASNTINSSIKIETMDTDSTAISSLQKDYLASESKNPKPTLKENSGLQIIRLLKSQPKQNMLKLGSGIAFKEDGGHSQVAQSSAMNGESNLVPKPPQAVSRSILDSTAVTKQDDLGRIRAKSECGNSKPVLEKVAQPPKPSILSGAQRPLPNPALPSKSSSLCSSTISTDLDSKLDCTREGAVLSDVKKYGTGNDINSIVANEVEDAKKVGIGNDTSSIVAAEVEDMKNSGTNHDGSSDVDWNVCQNEIGESIFEDGMAVNEAVNYKDLDSKLDCSRVGAGLSEKQHFVVNEHVPDGGLESKGLNNVNSADMLLQRGCGGECVTEKEGEYNVSDLVWGKVRSHPWWPGQILPPSAASDKAMKHFKIDTYLIAYFGDQTFAWNEVSKMKPFRTHFSEMEKQSDAEKFCRGVGYALDEVARRVELGLSCQCLPKEVHIEIKSQVIQNAGVNEESSIRDGGDRLSTATSFVPGDFLQFLKSLAEARVSETDRLQFWITKAQFLAFSRWKGCHQLFIFQEHGGLLENDARFTMEEGERSSRDFVNGGLSYSIDAIKVKSKKRKSTAQYVSSRKCNHVSNDELSKIKEKSIPVLAASANLSLLDDEKNAVKSGTKTVSAGNKRGRINYVSNANAKAKRQKSVLRPRDTCSSQAIFSGGGSEVRFNARKSTVEEMIPSEFNPDEILLKLNYAAINPRRGYFILTPIMGLLRQIRYSACLEKPHLQNLNNHSEKFENKNTFSLEATVLRFEGTKDSYWTDRIIQGCSQEQVMLEPKKTATKDASGAELEASIGMIATLGDQKQGDSVSLHCEAENSSTQVDEGSEEYFPTALLLNFTNLDSIPPVENLNEIFKHYGPLDETETKILNKSKRAKVVFKRRADAEAAFSSAGKYSIFGPSLLSYRLHYVASKPCAASKGRRNAHP
ncbi:PWWP domain-containing protein 5-like [Primulina huaijiensis]|uniref:PWWP domain-containing protein 5-like n=1 Tax=Primulina huaijiensis TaxID=1492673 RepID=UPI003CC7808A